MAGSLASTRARRHSDPSGSGRYGSGMWTPSIAPTQRRSSQAPPRQASRVRASTNTPTQMISVPTPTVRPTARMTCQVSPTNMLSSR